MLGVKQSLRQMKTLTGSSESTRESTHKAKSCRDHQLAAAVVSATEDCRRPTSLRVTGKTSLRK